MAITSGSYTIGTGGDYALLEIFLNDIAVSGLTGNLTGTIISDITIVTTINISPQLNTYSLTITSNKYHYGYFGSHTNTISGASFIVNCKNGKIYYTNLAYSGSKISFARSGSVPTDKYFISFCLFKNTSNNFDFTNVYFDTYRCVFLNTVSDPSFVFNGSIGNFENVTFKTNKKMLMQNGMYPRITFRNCAFIVDNDTATIDRQLINTFVYGYKCHTNKSDLVDAFFNTGVGNVVNVNYTNEWKSTDSTNSYFLRVSNESTVIKNAGNAPTITGNNFGIRLNATPHLTYYSIGADDYKESLDNNKIQISFSTGYVATFFPLYPYSSIIKLAADQITSTDGVVSTYDNGSSYDKRSCNCKLLMNSTDANDFNTYINNAYYNSTSDECYIEMGTNSGFYPFGHDIGNIGQFKIAINVVSAPKLSSDFFNMFEVELEFFLCGTPPAYTFITEQNQGDFEIGTVTCLKFPQGYFQPERKQEWVNTNLQGQYNTNRILRDIYYYTSDFTINGNISKIQRLLYYITNTNRYNKYNISNDSSGYIMGIDNNGKTINATLLTNSITVTTNGYDNIDLALKFGAAKGDIT